MNAQRELAEETLGILTDFLAELGPLSIRLSERVDGGGHSDLPKLVDGLQLTIEASRQIQEAFGIRGPSATRELEAELGTLLESLLRAMERRSGSDQAAILATFLPDQLDRWKEHGIPALRKSLDDGD